LQVSSTFSSQNPGCHYQEHHNPKDAIPVLDKTRGENKTHKKGIPQDTYPQKKSCWKNNLKEREIQDL
jgi:hypothetical protein